MLDHDLPHFYADNFSLDDPSNDASTEVLDKMYFGRSVIAASRSLDLVDDGSAVEGVEEGDHEVPCLFLTKVNKRKKNTSNAKN